MKINLKNKIMLTVLAGGMLCANSVFATNWYGTEYNKWTTVQGDAETRYLRLTINNNTKDVNGAGRDGITNIYGSYSASADIVNNIVSITEGIFTGLENIESGCAEGTSNTVNVAHCILNVSGGTFASVTNLQVGYSEKGLLQNNILNITGGELWGVRFIQGVFGDSGDKENNIVNISGGTFPSNVEIKGAYSSNRATVKGNKVYITGGDFTGEAKIYGASTNNYACTVQDNLVEISGGTFGGNVDIYGACQNNLGSVTGNTVTISGGGFGNGFKLYGGVTAGTSTNNTLNLKIKMGGKASEVSYFQNMNFTLPSNITNGDSMLETASVTYNSTTIGVSAAKGVKLNKDDVIYLIKADGKSGDITNENEIVLDGAAEISFDGNNLILTLLKDFVAGGGDKEKAPVEGIAAGVAMINQSADLALGEGLTNLLENTSGNDNENVGDTAGNEAISNINTFGAVTANRSKYKTGSHVDMDGWGVLIGAGNTKNWNNGQKTTYGVFFEYGKGDFDTYNNDIHGEGNSNNKGVGVIARHTLKNNTYIDGAVRYGKQETEWGESGFGGYDTDSRYYGAAVGLGHVYPLENNDELDVYVRYSYGHVGASDAKVKDSDYHFDRVLSQRLRFGAKYNFVQKDNKVKPYVGMAWERELKGESRATITGVGEAPAPSLEGNTGIFEIGCDWDTGKWILGAEANAYIGKRKGWGGMVNAFYNF